MCAVELRLVIVGHGINWYILNVPKCIENLFNEKVLLYSILFYFFKLLNYMECRVFQ